MGIRSKAAVIVGGSVGPMVQRAAQQDIDDLMRRCLHQAVEEWIRDGLPSFDHFEASKTVQLFGRIDRATRTPGPFFMLEVDLEGVELSPDVLAGRSSAIAIPRPDMRFRIGSVSRLVECKRLSAPKGLPRLYVEEGMLRFIGGKYSADADRGTMVGYVEDDDEKTSVARVNSVITSHGSLGPGNELGAPTIVGSRFVRRSSEHDRTGSSPIELDHLLIDIR